MVPAVPAEAAAVAGSAVGAATPSPGVAKIKLEPGVKAEAMGDDSWRQDLLPGAVLPPVVL
eukprot:12597292-Alexandrium_andersonii.AAC.1